MSRNTGNCRLSCLWVIVLIVVAFAAGAGAGIFGWIWLTGGSGEASISAEDVAATLAAEPAAASVDSRTEFVIDPAESRATFTMEEDLRGVRTTVVGSTNDVSGTIRVNMEQPAQSAISRIVVNARTLATDNSIRDRAIRGSILRSSSDEYEFITFEPRLLENFSSETVAVGESITFDITGELTIVEITHTVTFSAQVAVVSETEIAGSAHVNILYADFNLAIPNSPSATNITDDVDLRINFTARPAE